MKISFCGCVINARHEVRKLVEFLWKHNQDAHIEVCIALDNRVEDGSKEELDKLRKEYPTIFKYIEVTHEDTVDYLRKLIQYYRNTGKFKGLAASGDFVDQLETNLNAFEKKELFDHNSTFLWMSSGWLYNKAVSISTGDVVVVGPADFLPLYRAHDIKCLAKDSPSNFYSKPHAVFARITNLPETWLREHLHEVHHGKYHRPGYRWDSEHVFLDYMQYPSKLEEYWLPDFKHNKLINCASPRFIPEAHEFSKAAHSDPGIQSLKNFHGTHIMSRSCFDAIGGFTEEFYGRAFADDKMTTKGKQFFVEAPDHISFAWIYPGEVLPDRGPGYEDNWRDKLKEIDPWWETHPIPPSTPHYLHNSIEVNGHFNNLVGKFFNVNDPPVRIV